MTEPIEKPGPGGRRPGAGRPKGARNHATLAREAKARALIAEVVDRLDLDAKQLTPLETLLLLMTTALRSGDLAVAQACARDAAPYCHPRLAASDSLRPLPDDLAPDPAPVPDEPAPANAIH